VKHGMSELRFYSLIVFGLIVLSGNVDAQLGRTQPSSKTTYSNANLGFLYPLPRGMRDKTVRFKSDTREQATYEHTSNTLNAVLAASTGTDGSALDWCSVTIESYPRSALPELDDSKAKAQMNAWVAHSKNANSLPKSVTISGQAFTVSVFGLQEGMVRKGAVVFTTVRKEKLLSFAFVANSPQQLKALTETMKTVQFF
jgi:hypothetical protein